MRDNPAPSLSAEGQGRLPERLSLLGTMAAGIAQEFSNLLSAVTVSLDQIQRNPMPPRGKIQLEQAQWGVQQAGRLAKQILSFTRPDHGRVDIVDLNDVISHFDKMLDQAAGPLTMLRLDLAPQPLPARLNPAQLEMALLQLVRNGANAMRGRGAIMIRTAAHPLDGSGGEPTVEVAISDTGLGMTAASAKRATDPFPHDDDDGLGFWIIQRFMSACGGKIGIETALGQGTTVRLIFSRHQDNDETTGPIRNDADKAAP
jgi:signal transduction histidine kinase